MRAMVGELEKDGVWGMTEEKYWTGGNWFLCLTCVTHALTAAEATASLETVVELWETKEHLQPSLENLNPALAKIF